MPVFLDADILEKEGKKIEAFSPGSSSSANNLHRVLGFPKVPELFKFLIEDQQDPRARLIREVCRSQSLQ